MFNPHGSDYTGLQDICFDKTGAGGYFHRDETMTLCDENSIIGRSLSFYGEGFGPGDDAVQACCTIEEITMDEFNAAVRSMYS